MKCYTAEIKGGRGVWGRGGRKLTLCGKERSLGRIK